MKQFYLTLLFSLVVTLATAQSQKLIAGKILNSEQKPISNTNIVVYDEKDQVLQRILSNDLGNFSFSKPTVAYYLYFTHIGYLPYKLSSVDGDFINVMLKAATAEMKEVVITGSRPFIEQQIDKMVVNIDGNPKAGINAVDILKKIPGVTLNRDELSIEGKGVNVLIDGKQTRVSGSTLIALLENTSSDNISKMEIIYNPSAKYDAAGAGGIINITTLKRSKPGYDGNLSLTAGHGWKYPNLSTSAGLNYKSGKNSLAFSYGQGVGKQYQELQTNNRLVDLNQQLLDSSTYRSNYQNHNIRIGFDRSLNGDDSFGMLLTGNYGVRKPGFSGHTQTLSLSDQNHIAQTFSTNPSRVLNQGLNLNFSYRHVIDAEKKSEVIIDADAGLFGYENKSKNDITEFSEDERLTKVYLQNGKTTSQIYSIKGDYAQKIKIGTLESGVKISHVRLGNDFLSQFILDEQSPIDYGSNEFLYRETILAAYGSSRVSLGKFTLQLGLRAEQTFTSGNSLTLQNEVNRSYLNLFPNLSVGIKLKKNMLSFAYGRRIGRPSYSELNPFEIVASAFSTRTGNPYLNPSYAQNLRLSYTYNNKVSISTSYAMTEDVITDFQTRANENEITKILKANISSYRNIGLNVSYNTTLFKFWQLNYSLGASNSDYQFKYNEDNQRIRQTTGYLSLGNSFQIDKTMYMEIFFYGQARVTYGTYINLPFSTTAISAGKKVLKEKGNLALSVNDIFFTGITRSLRKYGNIDYQVRSQYDSRNIRLNFSYRFGNTKLDLRRRNSGSEEEQRRNQ